VIREATAAIRDRIAKLETFVTLSAPAVDFETHDWPELADALSMLKPDTDDPELCAFVMACLAAMLRESAVAEGWKSEHHSQVSHEFRNAFARLLARFALTRQVAEAAQIGQILRDNIDKCPEYLNELLEAFPYEEDRIRSGVLFWTI